jgi:ribosomal-protein-alanine N-acetyltransferase
MQTFETERLFLRPVNEADAAFVLELFNSPKWIHFIGDRGVRSEAEARAYIRNRMLPQLERLGYGNYLAIRKADGAKLGTCGIFDREGLEGVDIGYAFLPEHEGQGYAFEAAGCIKTAALEQFGITNLCAITLQENTASIKLLEKLGLRFVRFVHLPDDEAELMLFELPGGMSDKEGTNK